MEHTIHEGYNLAEINEELEAQKEELTAAIEELERQNKKLHDTNRLLESRNMELDQLIYRTNHDLKSPITSIEGITNILKLELEGSKYDNLIQHIETNISTFKGILHSIVSLSQNLRKEEDSSLLNLNDEIHRVVNKFKFLHSKISVNCNTNIFINTDQTRLEEIMRAVITNAIDFKSVNKKSWINIDANQLKEGCKISIIDNGIGMNKEVLNQCTEMFYRGSELSKGAGLGLYVTKRLVEVLHGELNIRSCEGSGTTIEILLPDLKI